jgi:hypothetical protein
MILSDEGATIALIGRCCELTGLCVKDMPDGTEEQSSYHKKF